MAEKYKKLTVYLDEEQEKVLKDFDLQILSKEQFTLLHYTISLLSRKLDDTSNRIISDVDPNKCDPATLQYSSQTIG
jgi:hypothetical protein|tara:strand:- start:272 stop:502 length:231 start_codon:yes stop_codon:yes gene_type:complete